MHQYAVSILQPQPRVHVTSIGELRDLAKQEIEILAGFLGFLDETHFRTFELVGQLDLFMAQYSPAENEAIFSRLAAAYLPRLVDAALEQPIIVDTGLVGFINGYIAALEAIQRCAPGFLVGYMDSADPTTSGKGRMLPSRLAQLIGIAALIRQDHVGTGQPLSVYHKEVHLGQYAGLCTLLLFLIAWLPDDRKSAVFSEPLRAFLSKLVSSWLAQLSGIPLESHFRQIFTVLKLVLRGSVWDVDKLRNLRVPFPHYNLAKCHLSVCDKAVGSDQIYQCARCRTVLYCSKAHQKADWDDPRTPHGAMCYSRACKPASMIGRIHNHDH